MTVKKNQVLHGTQGLPSQPSPPFIQHPAGLPTTLTANHVSPVCFHRRLRIGPQRMQQEGHTGVGSWRESTGPVCLPRLPPVIHLHGFLLRLTFPLPVECTSLESKRRMNCLRLCCSSGLGLHRHNCLLQAEAACLCGDGASPFEEEDVLRPTGLWG